MTRQSLLSRLLLIALLPGLMTSCVKRPASDVITGELHGTVHWQGDVQLRGDVVLAEDATLTIAPGSRVLFQTPQSGEDILTEHPYFIGSELIVRGRLIAKGTPAAPIVFSAADPAAEPGSWGGINIEDSIQAIFNHCSFSQADSAIHARRSWVSIANSRFRNNLVGIRFHDTDILIEKNLLENNGAAIRFHFGSPTIRLNRIQNNEKGLFITAAPWGYRIRNNSFINNRPYQVTLGEAVNERVDLTHNYWAEDADYLTDFLYDGRLDDWLGVIEFQPLLSAPPTERESGWNR